MAEGERMSSTEKLRSILDCITHWAELSPNKIAYRFLGDGENETGSLDYKELAHRSQRVGRSLTLLGEKGERVLILCSELQFSLGFFGSLFAGMTAVPTNYQVSRRTLSQVVKMIVDADIRLVYTTTATQERFKNLLNGHEILDKLVFVTEHMLESQVESELPAVDSDDLAFLQYTSGSTSDPKGVMVSHKNLVANQIQIQHVLESSTETVFVSWLPVFHDMGLIGNLLAAVYCGGSAVLMQPVHFIQKPIRWLKAISDYKGVVAGGPSFCFDLCVNSVSEDHLTDLDLSSWQTIFNGAEPIRKSAIDRFLEKYRHYGIKDESICPCYGLAEGTLAVTFSTFKDSLGLLNQKYLISDDNKKPQLVEIEPPLVGSGKFCIGADVKIVDPSSHEVLPELFEGEIWIAGDNIAQGYWKKERVNKVAFSQKVSGELDKSYFRTGDLGLLKDGELFVTGRMKDLIIVRGRNHYPQDLEETSENSHDFLQKGGAAAFSIDCHGEEKLYLLQELKKEHRSSAPYEKLAACIRSRILQVHGVELESVIFLKPGGVLKTSSGKVQRQKCKKYYQDQMLDIISELKAEPVKRSQEHELPGRVSQIEEWILSQITTRMNIKIDYHEELSFFDLGLDSVDIVGLLKELSDYIGQNIDPEDAFAHPTIKSFVEFVSGEKGEARYQTKRVDDGKSYEEDIAIVGLSCRFPKANNKDEFWNLLCQAGSGISEVPESRWSVEEIARELEEEGLNNPRWGGFLDSIDQFDPSFFGLSLSEAKSMDPQQRLLLELSWEALEDAGMRVEDLRGSSAGFFVGMSGVDYLIGLKNPPARACTGVANSIGACRLSYYYDTHGPSMVIDTACSSSLVAFHLARQSLLLGESDVAFAGGVNLILSPQVTKALAHAGMLAADGRCKSFYEGADGYVRSEGGGIVVLKKLSKAIEDKDRIYCTIKGSAVGHNGRTNGLTSPNPKSQTNLIRNAIRSSGLKVQDFDYIEAHGSGTSLGDSIEIKALTQVFRDRVDQKPIYLGSVKANIGHLEPAAGVAGLIKAALSLRHGRVVPQPVAPSERPLAALEESPFILPSKPLNLAPKVAGVSSFGFGGTNAHVVLSHIWPYDDQESLKSDSNQEELFKISAHSKAALMSVVRSYIQFLQEDKRVHLSKICAASYHRRSQFKYKLAVVCSNIERLTSSLLMFSEGFKDSSTYTNLEVKDLQKEVSSIPVSAEMDNQARSYIESEIASSRSQTVVHCNLPGYPFQRKRCWLPGSETKFELKSEI